jgi:hypothetical protein
MKIIPIKPITPELVKEAEDLASKAGRLEERIIERIHYIMVSIFKTFNKKEAYWYFYGAEEGDVGDLWKHYNKDDINVVVINAVGGDKMIILLKDGSEWGFEDSIPTRWLFEDFEEELSEGKKKFKEKEESRKLAEQEKRRQKKDTDVAIAKVAKAKLSKKELAALKRTL